MRKPTKKSLLLTTVAMFTAMLLSVTTAQAVTLSPPSVIVNTLHGTNGMVDVGEFEASEAIGVGAEDVVAEGGYFLDVLDPNTQVYGFAVSINSAAFPYSSRSGWNGVNISRGYWNMGPLIGSSGSLSTTAIGTFSSLFGDDLFANLYYNVEGLDITEADDTDQNPGFPTDPTLAEFFFSNGVIVSNFVAFNSTGGIISQSLLTKQAVPEPSTIFLFGTGIVGLMAHTARKKYKQIAG